MSDGSPIESQIRKLRIWLIVLTVLVGCLLLICSLTLTVQVIRYSKVSEPKPAKKTAEDVRDLMDSLSK